MCGIIGYIGKKNAVPILLQGLRRVLYRGYDSTGLVVFDGKKLYCVKAVGPVENLEKKLNNYPIKGNLGLAHCLPPDTLIQLADGRIIPISKIKNGDKVLTLNPKTLKFSTGKVKVFRHKSPEYLYEIKTSFGSLVATAEHKMLVLSDGEIQKKRVNELSERDFLILPKQIKINGEKIKFKEIFVKRYYRMTDLANQLIRAKLKEGCLTGESLSNQAGVSRGYISHLIKNDRNFREDVLERVLPFLNIRFSLEHFIPQNTIHGKFINLPKESSPELMQIIGYFLGDGTLQPKTIRFKDTDKDVLDVYQKLIKKVFGIKGRIVSQKGTKAYLLEVNSTFLSKWLKENVVSREEELLEEVGQLPEKEIAAFLRGLFDAEGCVHLASQQISLRLTNKIIVKTAQILLLKFGIISSFYVEKKKIENWKNSFGLFINRGIFFERFGKKIGFTSQEKSRKLHLLILQRKNPTSKKKKNNNLVFQPILKIRKVKSNFDYLYDLEVTPYSNFIANGFFSHNSRWATHGRVSEENAHPHFDCQKNIFLVHNGIIENFDALKEKLIREGHKFSSETDTEVLCHLIEKYFKGNLEEATRQALKEVVGAYAIAVISSQDPQKIVFARYSSPLIVGLGQEENFIASDAPALLAYTRKVIYLEDGEMGVITKNDFKIFNLNSDPISKKTFYLEWTLKQAEKGGYPHFMLKEIMEEPETVKNALRGRIILDDGMVKFGGLEKINQKLKEMDRLIIIGMGTALLAGKVGEYMIEEYAQIPVEVENASEFRYKKPILRKNDVLLAISQSGETADTLLAIKEAKRKGILTLGIVNVVGSSIAREVDAGIYNHAGPEIGVAATKSFVSQLAILALLTVFLGRQKEMSLVMGRRILEELLKIPSLIEEILSQKEKIKELAQKYLKYSNFLFLGRKYNYPIALEGALKLKEISYVHAEGYPAGEMKHGPIAMIDKNFPSFVIVPKDSVYEKMVSNIQEIKAREGKIIAITSQGNNEIEKFVDDCIFIPKTLEMLTPILSVIPLQLFAYFMATLKGLDPDKPRNLAKSVTVE